MKKKKDRGREREKFGTFIISQAGVRSTKDPHRCNCHEIIAPTRYEKETEI